MHKIFCFIVTVFMFQTDTSVHLPLTHFCMLHLILLSYIVITVNSSHCSCNLQFYTMPSFCHHTCGLQGTAVLFCIVTSHRCFNSTVQAIQIHSFTEILIFITLKIRTLTWFVGRLINMVLLVSSKPHHYYFSKLHSLCVSQWPTESFLIVSEG